MAWKAECNRRSWYCIFGWDATSWFSEYSYNEWRRSLTPAQIRKLEEYEKKQKEKREKDLEDAFSATLTMCADIIPMCADIIRHLNTISCKKGK